MEIRIRRGIKQNSFQKYAMIKVVGDPNFNAFKLRSNKGGVFGEFDVDLEIERQDALRCAPSYVPNPLHEGEVAYDAITLVGESTVKIEYIIDIIKAKITSHYSDAISRSKRKEECDLKWKTDEDEIIRLDIQL